MSLRLRLGLWYGVLTGLVVLLTSMVTYAVHSRTHYDELDRTLVGAAEHLMSEYTRTSRQHDLPQLIALPIASSVVVRVYSPSGKIVSQIPLAASAPAVDPRAVLREPSRAPFDPLVGLAPSLLEVHAGHGTFGMAQSKDGTRWRIYVLPVGTTGQNLMVVASLERIDVVIAGFRQLVVFFALSSAAVTFFVGWLLARRALRPVAILTTTAAAIAGSRRFNQRVPVVAEHDELGHLATTFNQMLSSLEQAYLAQQRFVADASHELRAPLTAIQANLELLEYQTEMSPVDRLDAVREASREARRLAALVADLLALARADAGVPLRSWAVDLDRVLIDTVREAHALTRGTSLVIEHLEPVVVQGDPDRLKQLLLILLDNAIKYTPPSGQITVTLCRKDEIAQVVIVDTGIGIASKDLPHVFERFYRADPARTRDTGGTGLGLPIAQWIAEQHGGDVTLLSQVGTGTTATVHLPVKS